MVEQYYHKKSKFTFCYSALKSQIFETSKQRLVEPKIAFDDESAVKFQLRQKLSKLPKNSLQLFPGGGRSLQHPNLESHDVLFSS
jgi:hypothetical protein